MTCIVAIEHPAGVIMGADRFRGWPGGRGFDGGPKIFTNGPLLIGSCGSIRMSNLLRYTLDVPPCDTWDIDAWMTRNLAPALRTAFSEGGYETTESGAVSGGVFLAAMAGRVYDIHSDYSWTRSEDGQYAIGSGEDYAYGALHAARRVENPAERVAMALAAAIYHCSTVAAPVDIFTQEGTTAA